MVKSNKVKKSVNGMTTIRIKIE